MAQFHSSGYTRREEFGNPVYNAKPYSDTTNEWCQTNCSKSPPYCPTTKCTLAYDSDSVSRNLAGLEQCQAQQANRGSCRNSLLSSPGQIRGGTAMTGPHVTPLFAAPMDPGMMRFGESSILQGAPTSGNAPYHQAVIQETILEKVPCDCAAEGEEYCWPRGGGPGGGGGPGAITPRPTNCSSCDGISCPPRGKNNITFYSKDGFKGDVRSYAIGNPRKQAFSAFGTDLCHDTYTPWSEDLETPNKIGFTPHSAYIGGDYALKMYGKGGSSDHKCGSSVTLCDCKRECNFYPAMASFEKNITLQDTTGGLYLDVCSEEAAMPTPQVTQVPIDSNILQIMKAYPDTVPASFNLPSGKNAVCKDGMGNAQCGDGFYTWENFLKAVHIYNSQTTLSKFMSEVDLEKKARTLCSFFAVASATTFEYTACKVRVASKGTVVGCQPEMKPCSQSSVTYKSFRQTQDQMEKYQCMSGKHVERCTDAWGGNLPGPYCYFSRGAIPLEDVRNYSDLEVYFDNMNVKYNGKPIRICNDPDIICRDPVLCWLVAIGVWKMHMDGHPDLPKQEWMEIKDLTILAEDHVASENDPTKPRIQGQGLCEVWNAANFQAKATPSDITTYCTAERNGQYVKTCTGLWECNEGTARWVADRPGVGSGTSPFASDVAAAAGNTQSVLGQCYAYGVNYKGEGCNGNKHQGDFNVNIQYPTHEQTTPSSHAETTPPPITGMKLCETWNKSTWPKNMNVYCEAEENDGKYARNCNGLYECKNKKLSIIAPRPAVGDQSKWMKNGKPAATLPYSTDLAASLSEKDSVVGQCYQYGLDYKNVDVPYSCWSGTDTGNFHVNIPGSITPPHAHTTSRTDHLTSYSWR